MPHDLQDNLNLKKKKKDIDNNDYTPPSSLTSFCHWSIRVAETNQETEF